MNTLAALELLIQLSIRMQHVAAILNAAHAQDREITDEELDQFVMEDDAARARLMAAIGRAKAEHR